MSHPYIKINKSRVYLDAKSARDGYFKIEPGTMSEQCEDCGEDIAETGTLYGCLGEGNGCGVVCEESYGGCGTAFYKVIE